jgi:hypothetical protein
MTEVPIRIPYEISKAVYDEITAWPNLTYIGGNEDGFKHVFKFEFTSDQEITFKRFLAIRLGIYGDDLAKYSQRPGAIPIFTTNFASTMTNIGSTFKNVYPVSDGLSIPLDIFGYTKMRIQVHWSIIGTGVQSFQIIDKNAPNGIFFSIPTLVNGPNNSAVLDIPIAFQEKTTLFVMQAKSTVALDDPVFLGIRILML